MNLDEVLIPIKKSNSLSSNSNSVDIVRSEESWTSDNQAFILQIKNDSEFSREQHSAAFVKNKKMYIAFSIPTIIIPLIVANCAIFLDTLNYIVPISLTIVSILNGLSVLFDFSKKSQLHDSHAARYHELTNSIATILVRGKAYRPAFDVTLTRISQKKAALDASAPPL
jgi:hypothetical protein